MDKLIKQLNRAGKALANAVKEAEAMAEEKIMTLIAEEVYLRGYEVEQIQDHFDLSRQDLGIDLENGLLKNEAFIIGEKATKQIIAAYRLEVSYRPEGFDENKLVMKVRGRVEDIKESISYPENGVLH